MNKILIFAICLLISAIFVGSVSASTSGTLVDEPLEGMDNWIEDTRETMNVPGAYVVILLDNHVVLDQGYGIRDIKSNEPVTKDTRFQIASGSKLFTGILAGILEEEGVIDLDVPVKTYIPEFTLMDSYAEKHATLRDLLSHRSGLAEYDGGLLGRFWPDDNEEKILRIGHLIPAATFRERGMYSNPGFFLAGETLGRAGNATWEDLIEERVYSPLKMTRSGTDTDDMYLDDNYARGYQEINGSIEEIALEFQGLNPAGSLVSTGSDMKKWLAMLVNCGTYNGEEILSSDELSRIFSPVQPIGTAGPDHDPNAAYFCGGQTYYVGGERIIEKNGALDGMRSMTVIVPGRNAGIVVLCNKQLSPFPEIVRSVFLKRLCNNESDVEAERWATNTVPYAMQVWESLSEKPSPPKQVMPSTRPTVTFAGTYESPAYGTFLLTPKNENSLNIEQLPSHYCATLSHWTDNTYFFNWPDPDDGYGFASFTITPDGTISGFNSDEYGRFEKISEEST